MIKPVQEGGSQGNVGNIRPQPEIPKTSKRDVEKASQKTLADSASGSVSQTSVPPSDSTKKPSVGAVWGNKDPKNTSEKAVNVAVAKEVSGALRRSKPLPLIPTKKAEESLKTAQENLDKAKGELKALKGSKEEVKNKEQEVEKLNNEFIVAKSKLNIINISNEMQTSELNKDPGWMNLQKAKLNKEKAIVANKPKEEINILQKEINTSLLVSGIKNEGERKKVTYIINEIKTTERTYVDELTKFNRLMGLVMQKDENFKQEFFDKKILLEKTLTAARKFEHDINSSQNLEDFFKNYSGDQFQKYSDAITNYALVYEDIREMVISQKVLDIVKDSSAFKGTLSDKEIQKYSSDGLTAVRDFAILPVQRLPRHGLLTKELVDESNKEVATSQSLIEARNTVLKSVSDMNTKEALFRLSSLEKRIQNYKRGRSTTTISRVKESLRTGAATQTPDLEIKKILGELLSLSQSNDLMIVSETNDLFRRILHNNDLNRLITHNTGLSSMSLKIEYALNEKFQELDYLKNKSNE